MYGAEAGSGPLGGSRYNSNRVTYTWPSSFSGYAFNYPTSVSYNGVTVNFYWTLRAGTFEYHSLYNGYERTAGILQTIDVKVDGNRLRTYKLTYGYSANIYTYLLTNVQMYGSDATLDQPGSSPAARLCRRRP